MRDDRRTRGGTSNPEGAARHSNADMTDHATDLYFTPIDQAILVENSASPPPDPDEHEGATEEDIGDRSGPGAGYDNEPEQEPDTSGVAES